MLASDAGGEILTSYAIALAALSLGPAGFGILSASQAFMDPFEALAGFGLSSIAVTVAARRGGGAGALRGALLRLPGVFAFLALPCATVAARCACARLAFPLSALSGACAASSP